MFRLNNETQIPEIGLGVYKMEAGKEMNDAVKYAYQSGYRLYDTAQMYKNEQALGDALKENKIPREDIFLISKVNNCNQGYEKTISSFKESLQKLQTEYLDAFLVHWPGQDKARMLDTWKAMEHLYKKGKVKSIGVCNFEISQLTYWITRVLRPQGRFSLQWCSPKLFNRRYSLRKPFVNFRISRFAVLEDWIGRTAIRSQNSM